MITTLCVFQTIGTKPIAHIDQFLPEMLGTAELAEEVHLDGSGKLVKVRRNQSDHRTSMRGMDAHSRNG